MLNLVLSPIYDMCNRWIEKLLAESPRHALFFCLCGAPSHFLSLKCTTYREDACNLVNLNYMLVLIQKKILGSLYAPCLHFKCGRVDNSALLLLEKSKHFILMHCLSFDVPVMKLSSHVSPTHLG